MAFLKNYLVKIYYIGIWIRNLFWYNYSLFKMERDPEGENNEEKCVDPYVALEKIMRLDKKHFNF